MGSGVSLSPRSSIKETTLETGSTEDAGSASKLAVTMQVNKIAHEKGFRIFISNSYVSIGIRTPTIQAVFCRPLTEYD